MISVREFCVRFNLGRTKANQLLQSNRLASVKLDGRRLIFLESAEALIANSKAEKFNG